MDRDATTDRFFEEGLSLSDTERLYRWAGSLGLTWSRSFASDVVRVVRASDTDVGTDAPNDWELKLLRARDGLRSVLNLHRLGKRSDPTVRDDMMHAAQLALDISTPPNKETPVPLHQDGRAASSLGSTGSAPPAHALLGQQVRARIGTGPEGGVVVEGKLLSFGDSGEFTVQDDDGFVHHCWPLLHIEAANTEETDVT